MKNKSNCIPTLLLERFLLKELPKKEMERIKKSLHNDSNLQKRIQSLVDSNQQILDQYPVHEMKQTIQKALHYYHSNTQERNSQNQQPNKQSTLLKDTRYYAIAALILICFSGVFLYNSFIHRSFLPSAAKSPHPEYQVASNDGTSNGVRTKGVGPFLKIYKKDNTNIIPLTNGSFVRATDIIQISYTSSAMPYGLIFSIDDLGAFTLHFPNSDTSSTKLEMSKEHFLPHAYEFDATPGQEQFFFLTASEPIHIETIRSLKSYFQKGDKSLFEQKIQGISKNSQLFSIILTKEML